MTEEDWNEGGWMRTLGLRLLWIRPLNGWGNGVGVLPVAPGTNTMWVSVAVI